MIDIDELISNGVWLEGGRTWPEVDCYGIILECRKRLGLPAWPDFEGITKRNDGLHREGTDFVSKAEPCEPCHGAVACCYGGTLMTHVAIVVDTPQGMHVIECNPKHNVSVTPCIRFKRRFARVEFYR